MRYFIFLFILMFSGILRAQNDGENFFGSPQVHEINITFQQSNFWDSLTLYYTQDRYMQGDVEIDGLVLNQTGVQLKGNSSYNSYPGVKKSFNLDFNEYISGQEYDGLKKLNLNNGFKDPTMLREKMFLEFCRMAGIPAPRCTFARVTINGSYWGLYSVVEQVNKSFLGIHYGDNSGNLYKGDPHGTLEWKGPSPSSYQADYELKTNEDINDWSDLVTLIDRINHVPAAAYYDSLVKVMDVDSYMNYWAASNLFVNLDSYIGSGHNYYIYHDSVTGTFFWIPWDVNEAFGNFQMMMPGPAQLQGLSIYFIPNPPGSRPLNNFILQNVALKNLYTDAVCRLTENYFREDVLFPLIDSLADLIRQDYYDDPNKMFTNQHFEDNILHVINVPGVPGGSNIPGLKSFITARRDTLTSQLAANNCFLNAAPAFPDEDAWLIYPNPASSHLTIDHLHFRGDAHIYDHTGKEVLSFQVTDNKTRLDVSKFCPGIYCIVAGNSPGKKFSVVY